jgi:hypothetical protein
VTKALVDLAAAVIALSASVWWHLHEPTSKEPIVAIVGAIGWVGAAGFHLGYAIGAHAVRLQLVIDNSPDCLPTSRRAWGDGVPRDRLYVRLKLYNHSSSAGANVCVKLLDVRELTRDGQRKLDYPNPKFLRWNWESNGPYAPKALQPGGPQYVDVLYTVSTESGVNVVLTDVEYTPVGLEPGKSYGFEVQSNADNAGAVTRRFYVTFGLVYNDVRIYGPTRFWLARVLRRSGSSQRMFKILR